MTSAPQAVTVEDLPAARRAEMLGIVADYYRDPERSLDEELRFGDRVYYLEDGDRRIGAFLIVNLDYHRAAIDGLPTHLTYLGLGCAKRCPMIPLFQRVKADFAARVPASAVGVMHLSTRTPFAIVSLEKAFGNGMFPAAAPAQDPAATHIAAYIKSAIHKHPDQTPGEAPFVLRSLKPARFCDAELARIRGCRAETALGSFAISCDGSDELIVFHRFVA